MWSGKWRPFCLGLNVLINSTFNHVGGHFNLFRTNNGDFLFIIFINDIFFINTDVTIYNYVADNCISYAHNDICIIKNILECDVKKMLDWCKSNSWEANPSKFQSMLLKIKTINAEDFSIIVDNNAINLTDSMTALGVNIDDKLNFNSHVSNMCRRPVDSWMFCNDSRVL